VSLKILSGMDKAPTPLPMVISMWVNLKMVRCMDKVPPPLPVAGLNVAFGKIMNSRQQTKS
jgi:hypothetical protein